MSWLKRLRKKTISVSVIGVGNAGCRIGKQIISKLKENRINVKSLAINPSDNFNINMGDFGEKYWFNEKKLTTNKDLDLAKSWIENNLEELRNKLEKVVFYKIDDTKEEERLALHLVIGSGGGTGAAGSMIASQIIKEITGTPPTVVFVVPEKDEPSLVQFNTASALYFLGFDNQGPKCPIILFDNEKLISFSLDKTVKEALDESNNYLAETLTTTILAALQETTHEEYNAGLEDFFKSFSVEAKGLGVIISVDKTFESMERARNIRFSDIFFNELEETSSLTTDVTKARRGFLTITAPDSYQITFETQKLVKRFEKGTIKVA
ncbi:MAG: hypothetical protein ACTSPI_08775, partial [Candidatus Heimdallarchaeaceae archaeon]